MLTYEVSGHLLILRASGVSQPSERQAFFERLRADRSVRDRSLLLLDVRHLEAPLTPALVSERLYALADTLGVKLGPACAVLMRPSDSPQAYIFRAVGAELGLAITIFSDEDEARRWAESYGAG